MRGVQGGGAGGSWPRSSPLAQGFPKENRNCALRVWGVEKPREIGRWLMTL
jgi:hypothetical protein